MVEYNIRQYVSGWVGLPCVRSHYQTAAMNRTFYLSKCTGNEAL